MNQYTVLSTDIIHETSVDFVLRPAGKVVNVIQYDDTLPKIKVKLYKNNKEFKLENNEQVFIRYPKPDGTFVYNAALGTDETGTCVYFAITFQMTTAVGKLFAVIEIVIGNNKAASSPIQINVGENPIQNGDIESHVELGIIEQLLQQSQQAVLLAQQAAAEAVAAKNYIISIIGGGYVTLDTEQHITGEKTIDILNVENYLNLGPNLKISGNIIPDTTDSYDIGTAALKWNSVLANTYYGNSIVLGSTILDETKLQKLLELLEVFEVTEG